MLAFRLKNSFVTKKLSSNKFGRLLLPYPNADKGKKNRPFP